jgi:23S rRNA (adenine2503-C2)-methyltransferase
MERPHLFGLLPGQLAAELRARGVEVRDAEARRILAHVIGRGRSGFPTKSPVPRRVERAVDEHLGRAPLELLETVPDPTDGFVRYLFRSPDGALSEAVRIPLAAEDRVSVCLSSQVGCAMGCAFCATGRLGFARNLAAWEMVSAFCAVRDDTPGRVTGAVFMGQGEPLLNMEPVIQAARVLSDPCGGSIRAEGITVSTAGIVPAIRRYTAAGHRYRLAISLTSTDPARREALLPGVSRWPIEELADAIRDHAETTGDRVTVAWVVLGGVNTGDDEIEGLRRLFDGVHLRFDLIDVNDPRPDGYRRATESELADFRDRLRTLGVPVVRRYSGGLEAHAACGMLAARRAGAALPDGCPSEG